MTRKLFTLTSMLSLLLLGSTLVLWPLHHHKMSVAVYRSQYHERLITVRPLGLYLASGKCNQSAPSIFAPARGWNFTSEPQGDEVVVADYTFHVPGFYAGAFDAYQGEPNHMRVRYVLIAYPWLLIIFAALPILWTTRAVRNHSRLRGGRCLACGYSLT